MNERAYYVIGSVVKNKAYNAIDPDTNENVIIEVPVEHPLKLTIVSNLVKSDDEYTLEYGWTFLNSSGSDKDDKILGRDEAIMRLLGKNEFYGSFIVDKPKFKRIVKTILMNIVEHNKTPFNYIPLINYELIRYEYEQGYSLEQKIACECKTKKLSFIEKVFTFFK